MFVSLGRFNSTIVDLGWRYSKFKLEFPIGINLKFIHKKYYELEGFGLGVDIGGRLRVDGEELLDVSNLGMLSVGMALKDVTGTTIYWNTLLVLSSGYNLFFNCRMELARGNFSMLCLTNMLVS